MKWPNTLLLIRHDVSKYNILKEKKAGDPTYREFLKAFEKDPFNDKTKELALKIQELFSLNNGDHNTPLIEDDIEKRGEKVGKALREKHKLPDIIYVSPFERTLHTLERITKGWPELKNVKRYEDERIREQDHGLTLLYNDWRVFHVLHPEQIELQEREGQYWYRFPQGENVPDVRMRNRSWLTTIIREHAGENILVVTHHLNILAARANLERLNAEEFIRIDKEEKPINLGVTTYRGNPNKGKAGKLELVCYNKKYY